MTQEPAAYEVEPAADIQARPDTRPEPRPSYELTGAQLAWLAAATLFVGLRVAGAFSIPVGGPELDHLSGAWQAHAGNTDARFVPTLFQAVTAWLFAFVESEVGPRLLVLGAGITVPFAMYRLRPLLGEAGALFALVFLALDPVSILLGSSAWAGAWDLPLALWLLVVIRGAALPVWAVAIAGFLATSAGSLVIPVAVGVAAVWLWRQRYSSGESTLWAAGGAVVGWLAVSAGFGFGFQDPVPAPIATFAQGFERDWAGETTAYLGLLYSSPLLGLALGAAGWGMYACWRDQEWPEETVTLLAVFGFALAWVLVAAGTNEPVPLGAAALPAALVLGREVPAVVAQWQRVNWLQAILPLAGLVLAAFVAEAYVVDWARNGRVGADRDQLIVTGVIIAALACAGILASNRKTAAALFVPVATAATLVTFSGATGVAFGGPNEPLPSPVSSIQGREVRDIAVQARREQGGTIVIHSNFEDDATWPFRNSGEVVFASRIPDDATVVVWPVAEPAPEGFNVVDGNWSLRQHRPAPDDGFLDYLRWLTNRNVLQNTIDPVAVYLRTAP